MLDFLGIGAQKAGTTWLFKRLSMHPNIYFPRGKEMHFWDRADLEKHPESVNHYTSVFKDQHFYAQNKFKVGEITPEYATLNENTISKIKELYPEVRIFYSLRDPANRLWSAVKMHYTLQQRPIEKIDTSEIIQLAKQPNFFDQTDYSVNIDRWMKHFDKSQLCVVLFESFARSPYQVLTKLSKHIEVDQQFFQLLPPAVLGGIVFQGRKVEMPMEIRQQFIEMLQPCIGGVEEFIKKPLPEWRRIDN